LPNNPNLFKNGKKSIWISADAGKFILQCSNSNKQMKAMEAKLVNVAKKIATIPARM
jgi:ribosomal protein L30E